MPSSRSKLLNPNSAERIRPERAHASQKSRISGAEHAATPAKLAPAMDSMDPMSSRNSMAPTSLAEAARECSEAAELRSGSVTSERMPSSRGPETMVTVWLSWGRNQLGSVGSYVTSSAGPEMAARQTSEMARRFTTAVVSMGRPLGCWVPYAPDLFRDDGVSC